MDVFAKCSEINDLLEQGNESEARNLLISVLDYHLRNNREYSECLNRLIRETGLYPYLQVQTASWQDRFVFEAFKVNSGESIAPTLHREQSDVLRMLLRGESIAVSAPTSFGKTFIIDAFIAITRPNNVMIIVPTIALMDEVRRRLQRKFGAEYKIITTTDAELAARNLFIFPQERAVGYIESISTLDLLVVDEFYKASADFDRARSPVLLKAILKLTKLAKQRYYLAPNIGSLAENVFTKGMEFVDKLSFSTVFLQHHHLYREIDGDQSKKDRALLNVLKDQNRKTLIYAASYAQIDKVVLLLTTETPVKNRAVLEDFAEWLTESYGPNWALTNAVSHGVGIHNGQIHRSLSQIQLRLFDLEKDGLDTIVSTSSLIEGVNTSAEAVVLWKNRKGGRGNPYLDSFMYKNIIGRGGRMFKYFVGQIYLLEEPPADSDTQLNIEFPDSALGGMDEVEHSGSLSSEQIAKIILFRERMTELLGEEAFARLYKGAGAFQGSDSEFILQIAESMTANPSEWNGLAYLNTSNPSKWERILYLLVNLAPGEWDIEYTKFVRFVKVLSKNWSVGLPQLLSELAPDVGVDKFFTLEKNVTFKLSALLHDVNELQKEIFKNGVDVSPFVSKLSHAFLPSVVFQLEEYGLPRMISRKVHRSGLFDFEAEYDGIHSVLEKLNAMGREQFIQPQVLSDFEKYVVSYFFDGIKPGEIHDASPRNQSPDKI
jgi:hypothetical protein